MLLSWRFGHLKIHTLIEGYRFGLASHPDCWSGKREGTMLDNTKKVEYKALAKCTKEAV